MRINPMQSFYSVNFGTSNIKKTRVVPKTNATEELAEKVGNSLSTSTSGHRAPYGSDLFTEDVVKLITLGAADYVNRTSNKPLMLIGGDTRIASRQSLPLIAKTLNKEGVNVIQMDGPTPTPLVALAAQKYNVDLGVLMTASHNPWSDGGYNFVTKDGAIAPAEVTKEIAQGMANVVEKSKNIPTTTTINPYQMYKDHLSDLGLIDWNNIRNSGIKIYYSALNGTGSTVLPKLLKDNGINCNEVPVKLGLEGPNPTAKNLENYTELTSLLKQSCSSGLTIGLANDGDADRFGVVDENGNFIDPNDVLLLTAYHLHHNKGLSGSVITNQATSTIISDYAIQNGMDAKQTPVGFKYIAEEIKDLRNNNSDILVAGEESGGLSVQKHIPEKDGIIAVLLMADLVATENKPLSQILENIKNDMPTKYSNKLVEKKVASASEKSSLLAKTQKIFSDAIENNKCDLPNGVTIDAKKTLDFKNQMEYYKKGGDGVKFFVNYGENGENSGSILVRPSGTEPKFKFYLESISDTSEKAKDGMKILEDCLNIAFS